MVDLIDWLERRLQQPLPGWRAQRIFQPELSYGRHFGPPPANARRAAVMLLLYPQSHEWTLPLTLRPAEMIDHASQVSLPGGSIDPGETSDMAARRELQEELGAVPRDLKMLGPMSPIYLFNSNFYVEPWLACSHSRPDWTPNLAEVAELIEASLETLGNPENHIRSRQTIYQAECEVPGITVGKHRIWGGTSMILGELIALLGEYRSQRS
jgi:8-oxo-dGTP pyrophosphatase MutT (NUDIX family)